MKTIIILLFLLFLNACGSSQVTTSLNESIGTDTQLKLAQENLKIEYTTQSRGSFNKIIVENKTLSVQNGHNSKPLVVSCSDKDWDTLTAMVLDLKMKNMSTLEAPSKAHQYDGAASANFNIFKNGESYVVPTFDAGKPNKEIEPLVIMIIKIANPTREKN